MKLGILSTHPIQYQVPLYRELAGRAGVDSRVFYLRLPDPVEQGRGFDRPFAWDVPLLNGYAWEHCRDVRTQLGRWGADCVLTPGWQDSGIAAASDAVRSLDLPRVLRCEASALRRTDPLRRLAHRWRVRDYGAYAAIGQANRRFYLDLGIPEGRIFEAPYFVDNPRFTAQAEEHRLSRDAQRRAWGIPDDAFVFLFAGKLEPKKRPLDLVAALGHAVRDRNVHALIVGSGPLERSVREACGASGVRASFTGFLNQSEITRAYTAADCLILPSDAGETWGLVVNEAMVCGLPAVVSDRVGCGPDLVTPDRTGWTYPCGDVRALAGLVDRIISDPGSARRVGAAARERVLASYTAARAADGVLAAASSLAG